MARKDWQCVYCGRFMDDRRAVRSVVEGGWKLHACVACEQMMPLVRAKTMKGKQRHMVKTWGLNRMIIAPYERVYVGQDGTPIIKVVKR